MADDIPLSIPGCLAQAGPAADHVPPRENPAARSSLSKSRKRNL